MGTPISGHRRSEDGGRGLFQTIITLLRYGKPRSLNSASIITASRSYVRSTTKIKKFKCEQLENHNQYNSNFNK